MRLGQLHRPSGADGFMKITPPAAHNPSAKEFHARRCFLLGITDPEKVARLWEEERAKIRAAQVGTIHRTNNGHGRKKG